MQMFCLSDIKNSNIMQNEHEQFVYFVCIPGFKPSSMHMLQKS